MTLEEIMRQVNKFILDSEDWSLDPSEIKVPIEALKQLAAAVTAGWIVEMHVTPDGETVEVQDLETVEMPKL